jgi:phosphohistidine swiveling domain-containing protein
MFPQALKDTPETVITENIIDKAIIVMQKMLSACRVMESIGLKVKLPVVVGVDNKVAADFMKSGQCWIIF